MWTLEIIRFYGKHMAAVKEEFVYEKKYGSYHSRVTINDLGFA